jgi:hypothetical protein
MRKYVITLKRCTRKQQFLRDNRHVDGFEWVEGVDGLSTPELGKDCTIFQNYLDPYKRRVITKGEVGCFLSHYAVWNKVAGGEDQACVVLEDDVILDQQFVPRLQAVMERLETSGVSFDIMYLTRKALKDDIGPGPVEGTVIPGFSYWASAYVLSKRGARTLLDLEPKKFLMPVDELLPLLAKVGWGQYPEWQMQFRDFPDMVFLSTDPLLAFPRGDSWVTSQTEKSPPLAPMNHGILVFAVATAMNDGVRELLATARLYGVHVELLGQGTKWQGKDPRDGPGAGGYKFVLLGRELATRGVSDDQIVLFVDGYDVVFNGPLLDYLDAMGKHPGCDMLVAGERVCWPNSSLQRHFPMTTSPYRFPNSGCILARAGALKQLCEGVRSADDDQEKLTSFIMSNPARVRIDHTCSVFQTLSDVSLTEFSVEIGKSVVLNKTFSTRPMCIHGNGGVRRKILLNQLGNYLWYSEVYGCRRTLPWSVSLSPPDIFVVMLVRNKAHCLAHHLRGIQNLNYPRQRLHLYIRTGSNLDDTHDILGEWVAENRPLYGSCDFKVADTGCYTYDVVDGVLNGLRRSAADRCRELGHRYMFYIEADVALTSCDCLQELIACDKTIVAPLVRRQSNQMYTNFWGDMDSNRYYARSPDYPAIAMGKQRGCFAVPLVREVFLVDMRKWPGITWPDHPQNLLEGYQTIALLALSEHVKMNILNINGVYGVVMDSPPERFPEKSKKASPGLFTYWEDREAWLDRYMHKSTRALIRNSQLLKMIMEEVGSPGTDIWQFPLFSETFCDDLIKECESFGDWSPGGEGPREDKRIGAEQVPTSDIHMSQLGLCRIMEDFIKTYVSLFASAGFFGFETKGVNVAFVVRYQPGDNSFLRLHHDSSSYTVNVPLNPSEQFEGGGVYFEKHRLTVHTKPGWCLMHPGKLTHRHGALPTTSGTRYVLVSFQE